MYIITKIWMSNNRNGNALKDMFINAEKEINSFGVDRK